MKLAEPQATRCIVVFRLKRGERDVGRFIYELACKVEAIEDIEVVSLTAGDLIYPAPQDSQQEKSDEQ